MKIRYIKSATTVIECNGVKILTDPWLVDGEYYGSWYHYPALELDAKFFTDIDFIYISHIHPDHFSKASLKVLNKDIPILIHGYESPFLKQNIERLGFKTIELQHNQRTLLKNGVHINILAADNCNPELCAKFFGCGIVEAKYGSTQIDTLCVIDNGDYSVLNVNDCPYALSADVLGTIMTEYKKIDFVLVGYGGAGPFPQCFVMPEEEMQTAAEKKKLQFLQQGLKYLSFIKPRYYMPFAGTYTLGGKLSKLQKFRGVPELEEARDYFAGSNSIDPNETKAILLNTGECFDLETQTASAPYKAIDREERERYINSVLSKKALEYESDPDPDAASLLPLIEQAWQRMEKKRQEIDFHSVTKVLIDLAEDECISLPMDGSPYQVINASEIQNIPRFVRYQLDPRLLSRILKGPKYAHWNNAEVGSHIIFERKPEIFERGLYHVMCYFHS